MGLFHHVIVYMGDLQSVHPALNLFILDAGILIMNSAISKFDDVLLEHGGLPHVLPLAVLSVWGLGFGARA